MRYWYIDSANFVTLMLIDKGYYDYDYEEPKRKGPEVRRPAMSDRRLSDTLKRYGVGVKKPKDMDMEELQKYAMEELDADANANSANADANANANSANANANSAEANATGAGGAP